MTAAAVQFKPFSVGVDPVAAPTPLLIPAVEPLSIGAPPIVPDLVASVNPPYQVRRAESRSGHAITCPLDVAPRVRYAVAWTGLTLAQRNALAAWIKTELLGTLYSFDLEPDGPDTGIVHVRFIKDPQQSFVQRGAFNVLETEAEEVYS